MGQVRTFIIDLLLNKSSINRKVNKPYYTSNILSPLNPQTRKTQETEEEEQNVGSLKELRNSELVTLIRQAGGPDVRILM